MMTILLAAAMFALGRRVSGWLWNGRALQPLSWPERASSAALLGIALWLSVNWILSPFHLINRTTLIAAGIAAAAGAFVRRRPARPDWGRVAAAALALAPLAAIVVFFLWRGAVAPVTSADAFIYHMPRALYIARSGGYEQFAPVTDVRLNTFAADYELLLADFLVLDRSDALTEWVSTLFYVLMLVAAAAAAQRWWRAGPAATIVTVYFAAAIPMLLLHAAAYKNDVMLNYFALAAALWAGRWLTTGERPAAILSTIAICSAVGTKNHALLFAAILAVTVAVAAIAVRRRIALRDVALYLATAIVAFLLLGGQHYLGTFFYASNQYRAGIDGVVKPAAYGDLHNLWEGPALTFLVPFSDDPGNVWVPWAHESRFWLTYDLYASHYGRIVSILMLLLPIAAWRYRRWPADASAAERIAVLAASALFFAGVFPVRTEISGFVATFARYALMFAVVVICWTAAPIVAELEKRPLVATVAAIAAMGLFAWTAEDFLLQDKWAPMSYVEAIADSHGGRWVPVMRDRAELVLDRMAGPRDAVDVHGGRDAWLYPVYGASLERDVKLVLEPSEIRSNAQWVVVDRAFNIMWTHPKLKKPGAWQRFLMQGEAAPEDLTVFRALEHDPRWELVFHDPKMNQAVFRRRVSG